MRPPRHVGPGPAVPGVVALFASLLLLGPVGVPEADAASADPVPACRYADTVTSDASYDSWATTLVDTDLRLPAGYAPPDLVPVGDAGLAGAGKVRQLVVDDLAKMTSAASAAGAPLSVISAYRSEAAQAEVFAHWEDLVGHAAALRASALPGHSEHQLGTTIDFTTPHGTGPWSNNFGTSPQGRWLQQHAWRYGFLDSYPAGVSPSQTCYQAEPWHYRYVGRDLGATVHASGEPLRAYLYALHATGASPSPASTPEASTPEASATASAMRGDAASRHVTVALAAAGGIALPELLAGILAGLIVGRVLAMSAAARARRRMVSARRHSLPDHAVRRGRSG